MYSPRQPRYIAAHGFAGKPEYQMRVITRDVGALGPFETSSKLIIAAGVAAGLLVGVWMLKKKRM